MQLKRVEITKFVGIDKADIDFKKPVSLFVGGNNAGKSSVKDAIEFALTGKCRAGKLWKDAKELCRGQGRMGVKLAYQEGTEPHSVLRSQSNASSQADERPILRYCLNPQEFIELPIKGRAKVLAEVLGGGLRDVAKKAIVDHVGNIDETLLAEIKGAEVDVLDVDALRDKVIDCRRQYKRDIGAMPSGEPLLADYELPQNYGPEEDQKKVKELADRIAKGGELIAAAKKQLEIKAELFQVENALKDRRSDTRKVPPMPKDIGEDELRMGDVYCTLIEDLLRANKDKKMIKCPLSANASHSREKMEERHKELADFLGAYQDVVKRHDDAVKHNEAVAKAIATLEAQLQKCNESLKPVECPTGSENLLVTLTGERDLVQANIANHKRFLDATESYEAGSKRAGNLKDLIAECDRIDAALKDGGPVKGAIAAGGRSLPINKSLLKLWGMEALEWRDAGEISLGNVPIEYASDSERYRAGCVMGLALADVSNIGIAALDGFEILDPGNANAFMQVVSELNINNVLILSSTDKDYSKVDLPDWLEVFKVEQGQVTKL